MKQTKREELGNYRARAERETRENPTKDNTEMNENGWGRGGGRGFRRGRAEVGEGEGGGPAFMAWAGSAAVDRVIAW